MHPPDSIEGREVTRNTLDYTEHMSSIQAKYLNRDEEEKSGAKMRCGVQVGGAPGVRSHRHRAKMPFVLPIHVYHNFCLPHASLRQPLSQPLPTHGHGSAQMWQPRTPAMAAGLTDHVWTLREVLLFRVPPWPQPAGA